MVGLGVGCPRPPSPAKRSAWPVPHRGPPHLPTTPGGNAFGVHLARPLLGRTAHDNLSNGDFPTRPETRACRYWKPYTSIHCPTRRGPRSHLARCSSASSCPAMGPWRPQRPGAGGLRCKAVKRSQRGPQQQWACPRAAAGDTPRRAFDCCARCTQETFRKDGQQLPAPAAGPVAVWTVWDCGCPAEASYPATCSCDAAIGPEVLASIVNFQSTITQNYLLPCSVCRGATSKESLAQAWPVPML